MSTRFGSAVAVAAATLVVVVVAHPVGAIFAAGGAVAVGVGVLRGRRYWVAGGAATTGFGLLVAGAYGEPVLSLVAATVGTLVAYDAGTLAVTLGRQVGGSAETARVEAVHAATTLGVAGTGATVVYGAFALAGDGPVASLALLLLGAGLLVSWLGT